MSEEKRLKMRIIHKHKTYAEWYLDVYDESGNLRSDPFIPLNGELIIFDPDSSNEEKRFKFGNGITDVINLPFANEITELDSAKIVHGQDEVLLSNIIETYILTVDYDALLAFDTSELVIGATTTSVLGQAILGQMVLA